MAARLRVAPALAMSTPTVSTRGTSTLGIIVDALAADPPAAASRLLPDRPYPGFRPFRLEEQLIFFGRERQINDLLALLNGRSFLCVHGPSGSGKSSLLEAGLLATLRREHARLGGEWRTSTFRPGATPMWNLALALLRAIDPAPKHATDRILGVQCRLERPGASVAKVAAELGLSAGANMLLVADQFEEVFRYRALNDQQEASRFIDLLIGVYDQEPAGLHVAIAMRTDFLGDCALFPGLAEAVNTSPYLTAGMTDTELQAAIRGPAELFKGSVDNALMDRLLKDSAGEQDRLPVLQHILKRCWTKAAEAGAPGCLTEAVYLQAGGVSEGLNQDAGEVVADLARRGVPETAVELTFRALGELDGDGRAIRRPVPWSRLLAETGLPEAQLKAVVTRFAQDDCGFLSRPRTWEDIKPDTVVDVAHEALLRRWRRMNDPGGVVAGAAGRSKRGWLYDVQRDSERYRRLLYDARLEPRVHIDRSRLGPEWAWWRSMPQSPAWGRRMGGERGATDQEAAQGIQQVAALFKASFAARLWRRLGVGVTAAVLLLVSGLEGCDRYTAFRDHQVKLARDWYSLTQQQLNSLAQLSRVEAKLEVVRRELDRVDDSPFLNAPGSVDSDPSRPSYPPAGETAIAGTTAIAGATPPVVSSSAAPTFLPSVRQPATGPRQVMAECTGAIWIGSNEQVSYVSAAQDPPGPPLPIAQIDPNQTYVVNVDNLRLRANVPNPVSQNGEIVGIVPRGTRVVALAGPQVFQRPNSKQYWLQIRAVGHTCSLVYMQFANGDAAQAAAVAGDLDATGFVVPAQEQLRSAMGLSQVRYYYRENRPAAALLQDAATAALKRLGVSQGRVVTVEDLTGWPRDKKPARGTLELWIDLSNAISPRVGD